MIQTIIGWFITWYMICALFFFFAVRITVEGKYTTAEMFRVRLFAGLFWLPNMIYMKIKGKNTCELTLPDNNDDDKDLYI